MEIDKQAQTRKNTLFLRMHLTEVHDLIDFMRNRSYKQQGRGKETFTLCQLP